MREVKVQQPELIQRLAEVFRAHGYEGANLNLLSEATGLKRASLYHRFPGGKEEMAETVLEDTNLWVEQHILAPLTEENDPKVKLEAMAEGIDTFYGGGEKSCLFDSLSFVAADTDIRQKVEAGLSSLVAAIAKVVEEAGFERAEAERRAEDAVIRIQGALVLARALEDTAPFKRVIQTFPKELLK